MFTLSAIEDFFFVSSVEETIQVAEGYLAKKELFASANNDFFYAWTNDEFRGINEIILRNLHATYFFGERYVGCWKNVICPSSQAIFNTIQWRGERFTAEIPASNGAYFFNIDNGIFVQPEIRYRSVFNRIRRIFKQALRFSFNKLDS